MTVDPGVASIAEDNAVVGVGYRAAPGPCQFFMDDIVPTAAPLAVGCLSQKRLDQRDTLGPVESRRFLRPFPQARSPMSGINGLLCFQLLPQCQEASQALQVATPHPLLSRSTIVDG